MAFFPRGVGVTRALASKFPSGRSAQPPSEVQKPGNGLFAKAAIMFAGYGYLKLTDMPLTS